ncbi:MAG: 2-oxoglutarate-dependent dioxygenase [Betaproteobacteria bacterium HGW-Betaproteobacteria-16]|nr:MAG: 2-oxoglutarate-dependent dioxygenase [Betaproteobacteria bacterium HGW-Betaproteobacteria-16]
MSQIITIELRQWILEQAAAGHSHDSILAAMVSAGWARDVASHALMNTLPAQQPNPPAPVMPEAAQVVEQGGARVANGVKVPDLDLSQSPRQVDAGDRTVDVLATLTQPRVVVLGGVLSDEECDALIAAARPRMARSLTVQTQTGGEELNPDRTSSGMFFNRGESELITRIEARIARLLNWPVDHGEGIQVLHYHPGAEYKPHYDYFDPAEPGTPTILKRGGQRLATLVMYLSEPARGGGTTFPDVGLEVAPQRGNAVFFSYDRPLPTTRTLHGGAPVIEGEKWVATKWLRERVFT